MSKISMLENLPIRAKFSPVKSAYTLTGAGDRYLIRLSDNSYKTIHQVQDGKNWVTVAKNVFRGPLETVQKKCELIIGILSKSNYR